MRQSYTILDRSGRRWGSFVVHSEELGKKFGYLKATSEFGEVSGIFEEHADLLSDGKCVEAILQKIVDLGVLLIDNETGRTYKTRGEISIDDNLLVSCVVFDS